ncbi:MAG: hypothetical protein D6719_12530 [Candidatus Dadabacteria bacterium]|nr:MAG: hypothetical protein D6719_12530 [Candidatus Dadabacteria bacterium]
MGFSAFYVLIAERVNYSRSIKMRHLLFSLVVLAVVFEHTDALAASGRKGGGRVKCPKIIADKDTKRYKKGRSYACYRKVKAAKKKGYVSDTTARMSLDGNWQMTLGDPVNECPSGVTPPPPGGTSSATLTFTDVGDQVIMFSDLVGPAPQAGQMTPIPDLIFWSVWITPLTVQRSVIVV